MQKGFRIGLVMGILSLTASVVRADVLTDWNALMVATVSSQNPRDFARLHRPWRSESQRHRRRRSGCGRDDRASRQRRVEPSSVLHTGLSRSWRVAADAGLSARRRRPAALAQCQPFGIERADRFRSRPETAIPAADIDGNRWTEADAGFLPFIATPCFPSYGSAHAAASYAARAVAESVLGDDETEMVLSNAAVPGLVLEYTSF